MLEKLKIKLQLFRWRLHGIFLKIRTGNQIQITEKGYRALDYYIKVMNENYQPVTYEEFIFEDMIKTLMQKEPELDRPAAAYRVVVVIYSII